MDDDELIALANEVLQTILEGCDVEYYADLYSTDQETYRALSELVWSAEVTPDSLHRMRYASQQWIDQQELTERFASQHETTVAAEAEIADLL